MMLASGLVSCADFLDRPPMDQIENSSEFYNSENNIRSTVYGWYDIYFKGYETGWTRSDFYDGTSVAEWCDDLAQETATFFTTVAPDESTDWSFENVRRINIMLEVWLLPNCLTKLKDIGRVLAVFPWHGVCSSGAHVW